MALVHIGVGTNLGDRLENVRAACREMALLPRTRLVATAGVYETRPMGGPPGQDDYYNTAVALETELRPAELLRLLQDIERRLGRVREGGARWGPRTVDLDIELWGGVVVDEPGLTIPHPRLAERAFVLRPLADLDPGVRHPLLGATVGELLERMDLEHEGIRRLPV